MKTFEGLQKYPVLTGAVVAVIVR